MANIGVNDEKDNGDVIGLNYSLIESLCEVIASEAKQSSLLKVGKEKIASSLRSPQ